MQRPDLLFDRFFEVSSIFCENQAKITLCQNLFKNLKFGFCDYSVIPMLRHDPTSCNGPICFLIDFLKFLRFFVKIEQKQHFFKKIAKMGYFDFSWYFVWH